MAKWEYKLVERTGRRNQEQEIELLVELNQLGSEGWEAIGLGHGGNYRSTVITLKREILVE